MSMQQTEEFTISPPKRFTLDLIELWQYRELFYFFTLRDIKVKYKQTVLGIFWAVLQPFFMMLVFTFLLGRPFHIDTRGLPYPLFVFSGLVLWNLFSLSIANAGNSMVNNASIIKKIYFPRLIIPTSAVLSSLVDFCFGFVVMIGLMIWYSQPVNYVAAIFLWLVGILITCTASLGLGCWLSALNVKYRDFRYVIPFLLQVLLFVTPIIYPITETPYSWMQTALALNPMYSAIEIFRAPLVGMIEQPSLVITSFCSCLFMLGAGLLYFKKTEMYFADLA